MNYKFTALILLILVGLLGVVVYLNHQPPKPKAGNIHLVFTPRPGTIDSLSLKRGASATNTGEQLAFQRQKGQWRIITPINALARGRVESLVRSVAHLTWRYRVTIAKTGHHSLSATGLSPARAIFTFKDHKGKTYRLAVGRHNSAGRLFVHPLGDKSSYIYVVSSSWFKSFQHSAKHYRNLNLTHFHTHNIASIVIHRTGSAGKATMRIIPHGTGWVITSPFAAPVNTNSLQDWLSDLQLLAATRFAQTPEKSCDFGSGPLAITIRFNVPKPLVPPATGPAAKNAATPSAPPPLIIRFGRHTDLTKKNIYVYSSQNSGVGVVPAATFAPLNRTMAKFRDKALTRANLTHAKGITLITGHSTLHLFKSKKGLWLIASQGKTNIPLSASATTVGKLLKAVAALRAKSFLDGKIDRSRLGLVHPKHSLTITLTNHLHPVSLAWGAVGKQKLVPVSVDLWPSLYQVSAKALKALPLADVAAFRSSTVARFPAKSITQLSLSSDGSKVPLKLFQITGKWMLSRGPAKPVAAADYLIQPLLAALDPLRAKKWCTQPTNSQVMHWKHQTTSYQLVINRTNPAKTAGKKATSTETTIELFHSAVPQKPAVKNIGKSATTKGIKPFYRWYGHVGPATQLIHRRVDLFQPRKSLITAIKALLSPAKKSVVSPSPTK